MFTAETAENKREELVLLFNKYQVNMENISDEDKQERYKNALAKLRREIAYHVADYAYTNAVSVYIPEGSNLYLKAAELVQRALPSMLNILWNGDLSNIEGIIENIREDFLDNYYFPSIAAQVAA